MDALEDLASSPSNSIEFPSKDLRKCYTSTKSHDLGLRAYKVLIDLPLSLQGASYYDLGNPYPRGSQWKVDEGTVRVKGLTKATNTILFVRLWSDTIINHDFWSYSTENSWEYRHEEERVLMVPGDPPPLVKEYILKAILQGIRAYFEPIPF